MCVVHRRFGAQVCSVVRWLFGCGLVGLLVVLIVPLFFSFLVMLGLCCFLRVTRRLLGDARPLLPSPCTTHTSTRGMIV